MKKIIVILIAVLSVSMAWGQIPDVILRSVDGTKVNIKKLCEEGKPTIISFFATWCKPCMRELTAISEVYNDWQEQTGVRLVAVSIDRAQDVEKVKPLVDGNDWDYIVLLDTDNELKRQLQVQTVPHTFIVNGKGKIIEQLNGYTDGEEKKMFEAIKQ